MSPSRSALGSGQPHKGRAVRAAQAREPPWLLGVVVRPPNGRSTARAGGRPGRTSAHALPLPPCSAGPLSLHPSTGRGFLVPYSSKSPGGITDLVPPFLHLDWATEMNAAVDWFPGLPICSGTTYNLAARRVRETKGLSGEREVAARAYDVLKAAVPAAGSAPAGYWAGLAATPRPPAGMQRRQTGSASKCETPSKVCASPAAPCPRDPRPGKSDRQSHTPARPGR